MKPVRVTIRDNNGRKIHSYETVGHVVILNQASPEFVSIIGVQQPTAHIINLAPGYSVRLTQPKEKAPNAR